MSRSRLIFIVFFLTAVLILTVLTRTNSSRIFKKYRETYVQQEDLNYQLREKQLEMARLTTPGQISDRIKQANETDGD